MRDAPSSRWVEARTGPPDVGGAALALAAVAATWAIGVVVNDARDNPLSLSRLLSGPDPLVSTSEVRLSPHPPDSCSWCLALRGQDRR